MISIILSIFVISSYLIVWYLKKKYSYWSDRNVFGENGSFPMGSLKGVGSSVHWAQRMTEIYNKFKGKDLFCGIYFLTLPKVLITDLDLIKTITIKDFNNFVDRGMYYHETADPLSAHLFNIEGDKWKNLRRKITPTFTAGKMKMMFGTVMEVTKDLKTMLTKHAEENLVVDIKDVSVRYTVDVIGSCAFGIKCNSLKMDISQMAIEAKKIFDFRPFKHLKFFLQSALIPLAHTLHVRIFKASTERFFTKILRETIEFREKNHVKRNDFLNLYTQLQKYGKIQDDPDHEDIGNLTFNELAAQAFVFFFAGFETSSTAISFCLYELACNQEIQNKLRNEISQTCVNHDNKLTYDGVMEMEYLGQVINETLRKYSPVNTLIRNTLIDYQVPGTSHIIEKNTQILIPVYSIHNDPDIYPNPSKFDPERFTLENIKDRHPYSFFPFGVGPRNCIGMRFATMQSRLGIISMIINFRFTVNSKTVEPLELDPNDLALIMSPKGGIWLNVEKILYN